VLSGESLQSHIELASTETKPNPDTHQESSQNTLPKSPHEFFGLPVYLTVSGQLHAELLAAAVSRVYTLNPTFRAEKSLSTRHLAEFWMLEAEAAFLYKLDELLDLIEGCIKSTTKHVVENCSEELAFISATMDKKDHLKLLQDTMDTPFARVTYTEAIRILQTSAKDRVWEFPVKWGLSLQSEHERYLAEEYFKRPVFVTDYPEDVKPFYMLGSHETNKLGKTVACTDLLVPGIGELIGGSLREDRVEMLEQKLVQAGLSLEDYQWYLDLRRYGSVPHGGFGLGLERYLLYLTGLTNVRDVIPTPRWFGNVRY
jgi:asparaginyl-tRNA synthetase